MTHVKNAEAFAKIVDLCTGLGGIYNPGRQTLQMTPNQRSPARSKK
jgi:hypothetical protein